MDWHFRVACPWCGEGQDRATKYFGVLSAREIRILVLGFLIAMLIGVLFVLVGDMRRSGP
jgi:hypothetical protein